MNRAERKRRVAQRATDRTANALAMFGDLRARAGAAFPSGYSVAPGPGGTFVETFPDGHSHILTPTAPDRDILAELGWDQ